MSEVNFAKSFLATLDKRAIKLPADHVSDPRKYPNESPYILPKQTHAFPRHGPAATVHQDTKSVTVTLKPMRFGSAVTLTGIALDASVHDLKTQFAAKSGQAQDKIKILLNKKPAADLKTLKDLGVVGDVELGVMIMGGIQTPTTAASPTVEKSEVAAAAPSEPDKMDIDPKASAPPSEKAQAEAMQQKPLEENAASVLKTEEFWNDLQGFLAQRLRNQTEGERLARIFRSALDKA